MYKDSVFEHDASIARVDGITREAVLSLFNLLLDKKWIGIFKTHYGLVKARLVEKTKAKNLKRRGNPAGTQKKKKRV
jgi:hypothetical protein